MSTLHKFKAYFGMVPLEEYEDDYLDDPTPAPVRRPRPREEPHGSYGERERERYEAPLYPESPRRPAAESGYRETPGYETGSRAAYPSSRREAFDDDRYQPSRRPAPRQPRELPEALGARPSSSRPPQLGARAVTTRGALAVDTATERREERRVEERRTPAEDGNPLSKITTLRPRDYSEARTIGERFRDGTPVIMDLVEMSNADAKRLVDFAAGLAFALRGSFDKVATKVFLLSPADIDVSAEERRRIAETGYYQNQR
jgi:cell division inhibitor SepF